MNLFARILSHGFALVVVALLAIGLIYRGDLFPGMELPDFLVFEKSTRETADTATGPAGEASAEPPAAEQLAVAEPATEAAITPKPIDAPAPTAMPAEESAADSAVTPSPADAETETDTTAATTEAMAEAETETTASAVVDEVEAKAPAPLEEPAAPATVDSAAPVTATDLAASDATTAAAESVAQTDTAPTADTPAAPETPVAKESAKEEMVEEPTGKQLAKVDKDLTPTEETPAAAELADTETDAVAVAQPETPDAATVSPYRLLAAAREAYWLRDYATAEEKYLAMIELDPDNPDGHGELGNMYFSQGKWDLAAAAYFEAGKRMADEGLLSEARELVDVIKGLQGSQASELEQYIADKTPAEQ